MGEEQAADRCSTTGSADLLSVVVLLSSVVVLLLSSVVLLLLR